MAGCKPWERTYCSQDRKVVIRDLKRRRKAALAPPETRMSRYRKRLSDMEKAIDLAVDAARRKVKPRRGRPRHIDVRKARSAMTCTLGSSTYNIIAIRATNLSGRGKTGMWIVVRDKGQTLKAIRAEEVEFEQ